MGFLDGMIGGMVGAAMIPVVNNLLAQHGGVQGIVDSFESNGLGPTVSSWVQDGPNAPVSPEHVHKAFGEQTINELAAKAGMTPQELAAKLAQVLPHAVDALTPEGVVPGQG
ncbi:MAG: YidB family protein [Rhizomicrobium sp.]